ncbi:class I SAM-dependent methyltransferase [Candidatus Woesearchaeota archaeon]|nr:class I SAM-dependent methyltransferase [Candidatus Woesearchaeota archaeon]
MAATMMDARITTDKTGATEKTEKVLAHIEELANKRFLHIVSSQKAELLERLVRKNKPAFAVETGTLIGYSAIRIARNLPVNSKLVSIEINKFRAAEARKNISEAGLADKAEVVVGEAANVMGSLRAKAGFVFFDVADYLACLKALESNGCIGKGCTIVANNVMWFADKLAPYLAYVRKSGPYSSVYYDFGFDGMEVSIRNEKS